MNTAKLQRGQALILIVFAIVGLVGITGLAVDGGLAYSDRRNAQNAADAAALAGALAHIRGRDPVGAAQASALNEGYNNNGATNTVSVTVATLPLGQCPNLMTGKDITVQISSRSTAYFAPVLGIRQVNNTVRATARSCDSYVGPIFPGDAIVALAPSGIGFDAAGTPNWSVQGGGIFSNSSGTPSARCKGASDVTTPSLTTVGSVTFQCAADVRLTTTGATQWRPQDYAGMLPQTPTCDGTARKIGNYWVVDPNLADPNRVGSKVAFNGVMHFGSGLFCVTNSPGPFHGAIDGTGVTFYLMPSNFSMKLNGGGTFTATAPTSGPYMGVLMFSAPQLSGGVLQSTQSIDLRGNGTGDIRGSIIVPSANVTMFGNSNSNGYQTQVVAYHVDSGGTSNIQIKYNGSYGFQTNQPAWLTLLR